MNDNIHTTPLTIPATLKTGGQALLDELSGWLDAAFDNQMQRPWQGIHDEATFVTAWAGYYAFSGDERVLQLALQLRDSWLNWAETNLYHGYHPRQEAHHGPEHYLIFLHWLNAINPDDPKTQAAILDAAHHIGNWAADVPAWYDWDRRRFASYRLGSREVGDEGLNMIEHLRFVHLALLAYEISRETHYLDFALAYGGEWAAEIEKNEAAPLYLDPGSEAQAGYEVVLNTFLGAAPKDFSPLSRLENHVANGTPRLFIDLWRISDDERFARAAKKLIRPLISELADPDANPAGYLVSLYRQAFQTTALDTDILTAIGPPPNLDKMIVNTSARRFGIAPEIPRDIVQGIGKRKDMPAWYLITDGEDGREALSPWPSPAALALAYEISGDESYALTALAQALAKLRLARQVYRDGRYHGCTARSIAAICRGHGRCWGSGDVSSVLNNPAIIQAYEPEATLRPGLVTN